VAAEIILPVVYSVGVAISTNNHTASHATLLVLGAVLIDSGACSLPVSSFPNVQAFAVVDPQGKQYLGTLDFIKSGIIVGILEIALLMSVGFGLLVVLSL
jgi:di/tricarboxylate transporter